MQVGFIGAGKVGTAFGIFLQAKRLPISGYYSRTHQSAVTAAELTGAKAFADLSELVLASSIIAITTPDDQIALVTKQLYELGKTSAYQETARTTSTRPYAKKIFLHLSGVHSSELLAPLKELGATVLSLHPLMSFTDPERAATALNDAYLTLDGSGPAYMQTKFLLGQFSKKIISISPANKALYHAALAVTSNHLVTLLDSGITLLEQSGFSRANATRLVEPLVRQTVENVFQEGTEQALTGPIVRADIGTVEKHIAALKLTSGGADQESNDRLASYRLLGNQTVDLALRSGRITADQATNLKEVLRDDD